ncbi:AbrB family transcriptional regulator [Faunimonas sp. B44]|uniref:AbrB family transcriptional regulator n=1 Tax=Faunimonas sp. B44 TaxID=3461493 RepID=UPI0040443FA9
MPAPFRALSQHVLFRTAVTLLIGTVGGAIATFAGLPAGWLSGSLLAVAIASLSGYHTEVPAPIRAPIYLFLGIYAGTGVGPETIEQMRTWPVSFAILLASMILLIAVTYRWLNRWCGWDPHTALLSAMPGALAMVMAAAEAIQADLKKVAVTQTMRLLILIELIPIGVLVFGVSPGAMLLEEPAIADLASVSLIAFAGTLGGILMHLTRLPGGLMLGGMVATSILYFTGAVDGQLPPNLVIPGTIVLGSVAGSRLRPGDWQLLPRLAGPALIAFGIGIGITGAASALVTLLLGVDFIQAFMAFAPGAIEALVIVAFAIGVDPAYVAAHHVVRFFALALATPLIAQWISRRR